MAQLVQRLHPKPEIRGSNPLIVDFYLFTFNCIKKTKR